MSNCCHSSACYHEMVPNIDLLSAGCVARYRPYRQTVGNCQKYLRRRPRSVELWTQKLKSHLVRTQSLNILPLKVRVAQYIAIHATLTARDFFLAYFYPSGPFTCIFPNPLPIFLLCLLWLTPVPV